MDDNVCCFEDGRFEVDPNSYISITSVKSAWARRGTNSILYGNLFIWFLPLGSSPRPYHRTSLRITALYLIVDILSYGICYEGSAVLKGAVETLDFWRGLLCTREKRLE
jgi:hypothetical protein